MQNSLQAKLCNLISFRDLLFAIYHSITLSVYVQVMLSMDLASIRREKGSLQQLNKTNDVEKKADETDQLSLLCKR